MKNFKNGTEVNWPNKVIIYTDGASRGNPGNASLGFVVYDENSSDVFEYAESLGVQTNNYAEYMAVVKALNFCVDNKVHSLTLRSDSQLLVRQLQGQYKVKSPSLKPLYLQCKQSLENLTEVKFEHVRREDNKKADELANQVLDL